MPDLRRIILYSAVRRKLPGSSDVQNGLPDPFRTIPVRHVHTVLSLDVRPEIGQNHVVIAMGQQRLSQGAEDARFQHTEEITFNEVDRPPDLSIVVIDLLWIVTRAASFHLFRSQSEDENIVFTDLLHNFYVRAVKGPDGQSAVELKFHVARAGGFRARQGNLLAEIRGRNDFLCQRNPVIRQKYYLEPVSDLRIPVNDFRDLV